MNKEEKKCCRDCVHCVKRFYGDIAKYYCGLTEKEDRVSGELNYKSCYEIIDTDKCNFKKSYIQYIQLVVVVLSIIAIVGIFIFQWFNLMGE